jgi:hypothetical protein
LLEARRGETREVPLRVGRTPELTGPLTVAAVLPADANGVTATSATVAEDQGSVTLVLQFAPDARVGSGDRVQFRATGQRGGHPVIAEASLEIQLDP